MDFSKVISRAAAGNASDVHLIVGLPPVMRIDGRLVNDDDAPLTDAEICAAASLITTEEERRILEEKGEVDLAVTYEGARMRVNIFRQQGCTSIAMRLLPLTIPSSTQLGLPRVIIEQAEKPRGLVLVTGPTGSGKSSTLAALLDHINSSSRRHMITLENPIEYVHKPKGCIINQREVGHDTESFAAGLRAALRQDPDVILVGEMRDLETISTAITAAETGHLVFGTLHTKGAADTVDRIIDVFPAAQQPQIRAQLAEVLECVVSQILLPKKSGGRRAIFEVMVVNSAIRNLIRQSKTFQIVSTMQTNKRAGMQLMDDALADAVRVGDISLEDALAAANDPTVVKTAAMRR